MNVEELRSGLDNLADQVDDPAVRDNSRLAAVDRRIARIRRRRTSVVVLTCAALVIAAVALPSALLSRTGPDISGHDSEPPVPAGLTVTTDSGVAFYENAGGASLVAERVSDPVERTLRLDVAVPSLKLTYVARCWTPGGRSTAHFTTYINGHPEETGRCNQKPDTEPIQPDVAFGGPSPSGVAAGWAETAGLSVGDQLHVRMVVSPAGAGEARPQLVFALFTLPHMAQVDGVWYPAIRVIDGLQYSATYGKARMFRGAPSTMRMQIPSDQGQAILAAGVVGVTKPGYFTLGSARTHYRALAGAPASASILVSPSDGFVPVTYHGPGTASGTLWSVLYRRMN